MGCNIFVYCSFLEVNDGFIFSNFLIYSFLEINYMLGLFLVFNVGLFGL